MGGIDGSCEVWVASSREDRDDDSPPNGKHCTSCHAHFDSIAKDSVSILPIDFGEVHMVHSIKYGRDFSNIEENPQASASLDLYSLFALPTG
jgi:hypothetical protein